MHLQMFIAGENYVEKCSVLNYRMLIKRNTIVLDIGNRQLD